MIISSAGSDTSMVFTQPVDSVLCPTPVNPVVDEEAIEYLISIFPNPSSGVFTIKTEQLKIKGIEVMNMLEERIQAGGRQYAAGSNSQTFDLSKQPDGIYFVRVQTEKGVASKKLVLAR